MDTEVLSQNTNCVPAQMIGMMILEELRLMRQDVNNGIKKLQEQIHNLSTSSASSNLPYLDKEAKGHLQQMQQQCHKDISCQSIDESVSGPQSDKDIEKDNVSNGLGNSVDQICENIRIKQELNTMEQSVVSVYQHIGKYFQNNFQNNSDDPKATECVNSSEVSNLTGSQNKERFINEMIPLNYSNTKAESSLKKNKRPSTFMESYKLNHVCKICLKSHTSSHKLKRHYIEDHNQENKNVCPFCGRSCYNATDLRVHIRTHTGEKPFKCSICEKGFADKSNYTRHCRMRKEFCCTICNKIVCTRLQLHQHKLTHA